MAVSVVEVRETTAEGQARTGTVLPGRPGRARAPGRDHSSRSHFTF